MARIAGVNIPTNKIVQIGLTYIYGIGDRFSKQICKEQGIKTKHIELEAIKKITEKELSGNIRQLKNIIERLIILSENEIKVDDVMLYV